MKATFTFTRMVLLFFLMQSCVGPTAEDITEEEIVAPEIPTYKSTIKSCNCLGGGSEDFKVEAILNGESLCFDKRKRTTTADWKFTKADRWVKRDWDHYITIQRYNIDSTLLVSIEYMRPNFGQKTLPYKINKDNVEFCETIRIDIRNLKPYKYCERCEWDDSGYWALSSSGNLQVTILSFKDNVIEGTFEGDFINNGGREFKVSKGYFKTRLEYEDVRTATAKN